MLRRVKVSYEQIPPGCLFRVGPVDNYGVVVTEGLELAEVNASEIIVPMSNKINQFQLYRLEALGPERIFVGKRGQEMGAVAAF